MTISKHLTDERMERYLRIATTIGFGDEIESFKITDTRGTSYRCITTTGVIIVKDETFTKVITVFVARPAQIKALYKDRNPPVFLMNKAKQNQKKGYYKFNDIDY